MMEILMPTTPLGWFILGELLGAFTVICILVVERMTR